MVEDKLLVLRCKHGSTDAMRRIYEKYKDYLLTVAGALLNDKNAAEDVVHDVFVSFADSVNSFKLTGSLRGYLAVCVSNLARDRIRAKNRQAANPVSVEIAASDSAKPGQGLIETEELTQLRQAISRLPYEQRQAVVLHIKAGLKFKEIAKLQGVSVSTVFARYRYGLDKLRSLLDSEVEK